jgi:L-lactate dehydrogenase complex protein LldG
VSRDLVLARVSAALAGAPVPELPRVRIAVDAPLAGDGPSQGAGAAGLLAGFVREARAVGTVVYAASDADEAADLLARIMGDAPCRAIAWPTPLARAVALAACRRAPACTLTVVDGATPAALVAEADLGVTEADALVATSGTLVLAARGRHRGVSLLPPVHVAIVPVERLVADLASALRRVRAGAAPAESCITLVTGPSRTGDIEKKLVVGVHGPCALHVILLGAAARDVA